MFFEYNINSLQNCKQTVEKFDMNIIIKILINNL